MFYAAKNFNQDLRSWNAGRGPSQKGLGSSYKFDRAAFEKSLAEKARNALSIALGSSDGGVPWPHVRLMVRGAGGSGKSSTIKALAGKEFDACEESTVGAELLDFELCNESFSLAGGGSALKAYDSSQGEFLAALAAHAADTQNAKADDRKKPAQSIIDDLKKETPEAKESPKAVEEDKPEAPVLEAVEDEAKTSPEKKEEDEDTVVGMGIIPGQEVVYQARSHNAFYEGTVVGRSAGNSAWLVELTEVDITKEVPDSEIWRITPKVGCTSSL